LRLRKLNAAVRLLMAILVIGGCALESGPKTISVNVRALDTLGREVSDFRVSLLDPGTRIWTPPIRPDARGNLKVSPGIYLAAFSSPSGSTWMLLPAEGPSDVVVVFQPTVPPIPRVRGRIIGLPTDMERYWLILVPSPLSGWGTRSGAIKNNEFYFTNVPPGRYTLMLYRDVDIVGVTDTFLRDDSWVSLDLRNFSSWRFNHGPQERREGQPEPSRKL
jgi:hypothetical protein